LSRAQRSTKHEVQSGALQSRHRSRLRRSNQRCPLPLALALHPRDEGPGAQR